MVLACTKDVGLITEVEFQLLEQHTAEGFINQGLPTTFTIIPEAELEGYEYDISYEVLEGAGYFEDVDGNRLDAGRGLSIPPLTTSLLYVGTEVGEHRLKILASDNFGMSEEIEIFYNLENVPARWQATSGVSEIELGKSAGITLLFEIVNTTLDVSYQARYEFAEGGGTLVPSDGNTYDIGGTYGTIVPGSYTFDFTPEAAGGQEIVFALRDSNGQELKTEIVFTVVQFIEVIAIDLGEHDEIDMQVGDELECPVTFTPPNATDQGITLVSSDPDVVLIDENNICIALSVGTATVTATSTSNPDATDSVLITVTAADRVPVTAITVSQEDPSADGATRQLIATVLPVDATDSSVTWSSDDSDIATIDQNGLLTGLSNGSVTITATSVSDPDISGTITVEITGGTLQSGTDILSFALPVQNSASIDTANHIVTVNVFEGTDLNTAPQVLTVSPGASFGPAISVAQDFSASVEYSVTAENGDLQVWVVNVTVSPPNTNDENDIVAFSIPGQVGNSTIDVTNATVGISVPSGTDLNVAPSEVLISVGAGLSPSPAAVQDFGQAVRYTVTAENGVERIWTVNVTELPPTGSAANDILTFALPGQNSSTIDVADHTVSVNVPDGTTLNVAPQALTVSQGATVQPTADALQDFNAQVVYTVTAENGTEQQWVVNVTVSPPTGSSENDITAFELPVQNSSDIDNVNHTITVNVAAGTNINVAPSSLNISPNASISPSATSIQDFNTPVDYTVTAENGDTQVWTVNVTVSPDTDPPVIALVGSNPQEITLGGVYAELGATATDNVDGNITADILIDATAVNTNVIGSYSVTYNVSDAAGNAATQQVRTVNVTAAPDTTPPVIVLVGANPQEITIGNAYTELGATATDNVDGNITADILIDATAVNTNVIGSYSVTYNVSDAAGNAATQQVRTVNVTAAPDTAPPVIVLVGANPQEITLGNAYTELGATATDNVDGNITADILIDATAVSTSQIGSYNVTYNVSDAAGNAATQQVRTVNVTAAPDTTPPVIVLVGANPQEITIGNAYTELGATATDNVDGNITADILIDATAVNTNVIGSYSVTYNVSDAAGNAATQQVRTVNVIAAPDTTPPVIVLVGANPQEITIGNAYTELGATATDNVDGNITADILIDATAVNTNVIGSYSVTYNVSDASGNAATQQVRTVNVTAAPDTTPPVIVLVGANPQEITIGNAYTELGATATDNVDGNITADILIDATAVNTNVIGSYNVTYNVSDAAGNAAAQQVRTVNVTAAPDTTPPVIVLVGASPQEITLGNAYAELGATATDNVDGNITADILIDATAVNTNVIGSYSVTYNVSDAAGNAATQQVRTVNVTAAPDTTPPVIVLVGANPQEITIGNAYTELGATATDNVDGNITADILIDATAVNTNVIGSYNVTYNVSDAAGNAAAQQVRTVNVTAVSNNPPVAEDDFFTVAENGTLIRGVFNDNGNGPDNDPDGDPITVDLVNSNPSNVGNPVNGDQGGQFTIDAGGNMAFDTNGNFDALNAGESTQTKVDYRITDGNGGFSSAKVTVTVTGVDDTNIAPTANAGPDQTITLPTNSVTLNGSGQDTDGTIVSYEWTSVPSTAISNPNSATTQVTGLTQGSYQFTLTVTDDDGALTSDFVTVTVNPAANVAPTVDAGLDQTITLPTNSVTLNGSASDSDGTIVSYEWTSFPPTNISNPNSVTTQVTGLTQGSYQFTLTVTDDDGATGSDTVVVTVNSAANVPPTANAGNDQTITLPTNSVILNGTGEDTDGSIISYEWTSVPVTAISNPNSATTQVTGLAVGDYQFTLTVTDNDGASASDVVWITVDPANMPPTVEAGPNQTITLPTNSVTLSADAQDSDGSIIEIIWALESGGAFNITSTGFGTVDITNLEEGVYVFRTTATDDDGASATDTVVVTVNPAANVPPTAMGSANPQTGNAPLIVNFKNSNSTDSDGSIVGTQYDFGDGASSNGGFPYLIDHTYAEGTYTARMTVTDDDGATDFVEFTIVVDPPLPPSAEFSNGTSVSPGLSSITGTLTISNGPLAFRIIAFGGSGNFEFESDITFEIVGQGSWFAFAAGEDIDSTDTPLIQPGTYTYNLTGFFIGSSGNGGSVSPITN